MSLTADRAAIAAAASTVEGITVTPGYRQTTNPGQGMVRLANLTRSANGIGFMATWQVIVVMPQRMSAADTWTDEYVPELIEALEPELIVTAAAPTEITLDDGSALLAIVIEGKREA